MSAPGRFQGDCCGAQRDGTSMTAPRRSRGNLEVPGMEELR